MMPSCSQLGDAVDAQYWAYGCPGASPSCRLKIVSYDEWQRVPDTITSAESLKICGAGADDDDDRRRDDDDDPPMVIVFDVTCAAPPGILNAHSTKAADSASFFGWRGAGVGALTLLCPCRDGMDFGIPMRALNVLMRCLRKMLGLGSWRLIHQSPITVA